MVACGRRVEVVCFISITILIVLGTVYFVMVQHRQHVTKQLEQYTESCNATLMYGKIMYPVMVMPGAGNWEKQQNTLPTEEFIHWDYRTYYGPDCKCVRKCCPNDHVYDSNWKCVSLKSSFFKYFANEMCPVPWKERSWWFTPIFEIDNIYENYKCAGSVSPWYKVLGTKDFTSESTLSQIDQSLFCLESVSWEDDVVYIMKCSDFPNWFFTLRSCGNIISVIFLLISLFLYALQPALRNLHGKALICHMACLLIAQTLIPAQEIGIFTTHTACCKTLALLLQTLSLASAFWLNVLSFDIWWVFRGIKQRKSQSKKGEWNMFMVYSCYAWGGTILITSIAATMDLLPDDYPVIKPKFGYLECWFNDKDARVLFYELPVGVLLCLNLMMFLTTAFRLRTPKMLKVEGNRRNDKECRLRFMLYLKLFMVMGLNWLSDIVSTFLDDHRHLWIIPNIVSTLQGLLIFIVIVCNKRTCQFIREKVTSTQTSSR